MDGLNGQEVCGRKLTVDHLKAIEKVIRLAREDELPYKATGPDGKGWGKDRQQTESDEALINQVSKIRLQREAEQEPEMNKILERPQDLLMDEDEKWEIEFRQQVEKQKKDIELSAKQRKRELKALRKQLKSMKKAN